MAADLVISEFMASPTNQPGNIADSDGTFSDWIEVHNTTTQPLNLAGWTLQDSEKSWAFPSQTLAANGYLVVFASSKDRSTPDLHTNFKLSGGGEYLALMGPGGVTGSIFEDYPQQYDNISYGPNSSLTANGYFTTPTPGYPNVIEPVADPTKRIVINEIMFHPSTENDQHEFIELVNRGVSSVNLSGWQLTAGVNYTFGNVTLAPNQFLVVAAHPTAFNLRYPGVANVVGSWTGTLSNTGEKIELSDNTGNVIDEVEYSDEGAWGTRVRIGDSWEWESLADGGGRSLELRNWVLTNENGQNWGQSNGNNGTPGVQNSINSTNLAPLIDDVEQSVVVPTANQAVTITADISDESASGLVVNLRWRTGTGVFNTTQMFDDGAHGDGAAGDNEYGGSIGGQLDSTIVEYYVEARDSSNQTRTWPAPGRTSGGTLSQEVNAVYRVDSALAATANGNWTPGSEPIFVIAMTAAEYTRFDNLSNGSDAKAHGSFFVIDGTGVSSVHHSAAVRVRGASSRSYDPPPLRMEVPHDNPWHGYSDFNLNSKYPELQLLGSAVMREAGLLTAAGTQIQLRVNGVNGAFGNQAPRFGSYLWLEPYNSEFLDEHVPGDSGGNIYKKVRPIANWAYRNGNASQYMSDGWSKSTNSSENNWSDLDNLFRVMNQTPAGAGYYAAVSAVANVDQWVRWFAAMELLNSRETNLSNGADDDYQMFAGINDIRFQLLAHDLDTILGQGDTGSSATDPFFQAIINDGEWMPVLQNFFNDPTIQTKYYLAIKNLVETTFSPQRMSELIDEYLAGYADAGRIASMKNFAAQRAAYALSILPAGLVNPPPGPITPDPVVPPTSDVIINEVLAQNTTLQQGGLFSDRIELYNRGASPVNLSGMSISDSATNKTKYVFPANTIINPGQYLVLYGDSAVVAGEHHVGFALDDSGDGVFLYNTLASGQGLLDSVDFGTQVANRSIGRIGANFAWQLNQPSFGAANVQQATGAVTTLKINEWFASGDIRFEDDFIELFNSGAQPVSLAGLYLTDEAVGAKLQYKIPALSFIAANGYATFNADGETGGNHLPFQLSADFEHLGLFQANGVMVDQVLFQPQTTDYSQGRSPDGSNAKYFTRVPNPDVTNPIPPVGQTVNLLPYNASWRYNQTGTNLGTAWYATGYDPNNNLAGWNNGTGVLNLEPDGLPGGAPSGTQLTNGIVTHYFRTTFTLNVNPATATVRFTALVDDGAVFYVNGFEIPSTRLRMPQGAIGYQTLAQGSFGDPGFSGEMVIPSNMLVQGTNNFAVEVHQNDIGSSDVVMGVKIDATLPPPSDPIAPLLTLLDGLRITEIMYNPLGGATYEYIEVQNISGAPINMQGIRIGGGVDYTFGAMTLAAGARTVVVNDQAAFQARYGNSINVAGGEFIGDLSNGGDDLVLQLPDPYDAGILRFDYNDTWYPTTDGAGYSLVVNSTSTAARDWDERTTWRASGNIFGSPGGVDPTTASVNGQIFNDPNANGVQNAGETGRPGVEVSLYFAGADGVVGGTGDQLIGTVTTDASGNYSFANLAPGSYYLSAVTPSGLGFSAMDQGGNDALDSDFAPATRRTAVFALSAGQSDTSRDGLLSNATATVVGRHIFYNQSAYDGASAAANANDDNAIAPDKTPLLAGGTASWANYTNYLFGINGLMVDIAGLAGTPTAGDFTFRTGNDNTPSGWESLPTAPSVSVRAGAGVGGSDRVTLIWPNFAIFGKWLQVTVNPSAATGISSPDVFYWGNAIGEAQHSETSFQVTATDEIFARNNPRSFGNPAPIDFKWDYNRDTRVTATDQIIARNNRTTIITMLKKITIPAGLQAEGLQEAGGAAQDDTSDVIAQGLASLVSGSALSKPALTAQGLSNSASSRGTQTSSSADQQFEVFGSDDLIRRAKPSHVADDLLDLLVTSR